MASWVLRKALITFHASITALALRVKLEFHAFYPIIMSFMYVYRVCSGSVLRFLKNAMMGFEPIFDETEESSSF